MPRGSGRILLCGALISVTLPFVTATPAAATTVTYSNSTAPSTQTWTVPAGVVSMNVEVSGGATKRAEGREIDPRCSRFANRCAPVRGTRR